MPLAPRLGNNLLYTL